MLAPATPHIAEEFWSVLSQGEAPDMLATHEMELYSGEETDVSILARESYLREVIESARNLRGLAERHSDTEISGVVIQTAPAWKVELSREAIKLSNEDFDLVFIDIEGSEYFAMQGMADILTQTKTLIVEFLPHHITNVAGVKLPDFLGNIPKHLTKLTIPSKNKTYPVDIGIITLEQMFESGQGDDGIIFHN